MFQWILLGITFVFSAALMPLIIVFCKKFSLYDSVGGRKIHSGNIPRLGGVGIVIPFFAAVITFTAISPIMPISRMVPLVVAGAVIFVFGIIDDILEMKAVIKLAVQLAAVSVVVFSGYRFTQIFNFTLPLWFSYVLSFGWILGITNAYNLIDGLDGLCGGLSFVLLVTVGLILVLTHDMSGMVCLYLAASVLGFLVFNWPPAKIFMGDCGSQFLGFMIAVAPLYVSSPNLEFNKFLIMLVLVSIPMMDTIAAIWRRIREKRPIMSADRMHTHHKLMNLGLTKTEALCVLLALQVVLCISAGGGVYLSRSKGTVLLAVAYLFTVTLFCILHYMNYAFLRRKAQKPGAEAEP